MRIMRTFRIVMIAAAALGAAGCVSRSETIARHEAACGQYGFERNSPAFANCMMQLDIATKQVPCQRRYLLDYLRDDGCPLTHTQ